MRKSCERTFVLFAVLVLAAQAWAWEPVRWGETDGDWDGAPTGNDAQTVASYLAANVSATNYDALVDAVDYVATFPPVEPFTDWAQVATLLSGE